MSAPATLDFGKIAVLERAAALPRLGSILIHVSTSRASMALTAYAAELANLYSARLIGVSGDGATVGERISEVEEAARRCVLEAAGAQFADLTHSVRAGVAWTCAGGSPSAALAEYAWAADLIVAAVRDPRYRERGDDLRRLVTTADRPVLLCPKPQAASHFNRVAVIWSGQPACHRALRSALPLLGKSTELMLISAGGSIKNLRRSLALRGLKACISGVRSPADRPARLAQLRDLAPDLIVVGWPRPTLAKLFGDATELIVADRTSATLLHA